MAERCSEIISKVTEDEACIHKNRVEAVKAEKRNAEGLYNNEDMTSSTKPTRAPTRNFDAWDTAVSGGKRKMDRTSPESVPKSKKLNSFGKEHREKIAGQQITDSYEYMIQRHLREKCRSRSVRAGGSKEDLIKRLREYDAARAKENDTSATSLRAEPSDKYTYMSQKNLRIQCVKRSLPVAMAKRDLRRCLRLYDAARALGLTPEESLEAQRATFQYSVEEHARGASTPGSVGKNTFGAADYEAVEGHTRANTSREPIIDNGQSSTSLESPEAGPSLSTSPPTFSEKDFASSSVTTQDSNQDRGASDVCPGSAATPDYASMSFRELRSLCKSRSLKQHGFSSSELRKALTTYDRRLPEQASNVEVDVDAEYVTAELSVAPCASSPPAASINPDSSSQDGEIPEQQRTVLLDTSAATTRQQPVSGYRWTVSKGQSPQVSNNLQVEARQEGSRDWISARIPSGKCPDISSYSPRLFLKAPQKIGNESKPRIRPQVIPPVLPQQPLVSLLNLTIKDTNICTGEISPLGNHTKTKPLSEHAIKIAEKEDFNARYATESPSWICCCDTPNFVVGQKPPAKFSGNCLYHVSQLAQRGTFTMKEYQEYISIQQALDRIESCLCQKPADNHPEHQVSMTQGGFILAQIWREQLIRRQFSGTFRPDMAVYRRKGILEVMHNVLEDFMVELSSRQRKRPLVLWARIEAMAWFINSLPTSNEWQYFLDRRKPLRYIMLFGIAILTTIDALLQHNLFKDKESKVLNLGLVLALFIRSTWKSPSCSMNSSRSTDACKSPFNNDICVHNENGWAAEVVCLADRHGVQIVG